MVDGFECAGELALFGLFLGGQPVSRRLFEELEFGAAHRMVAELANRPAGAVRFAGLEKGPHLSESEARQGLAQPFAGAAGGFESFGVLQVLPGGLGVVAAQVALAALDEATGELAEQLAVSSMALDRLLVEDALCLFQ